MNHLLNKFDLRQRLMFFTLFFSFLIILCTTVPIQRIGKNLVQSNLERQLDIISKSTGNRVQDFFDFRVRELKTLRNSSSTSKALLELREGFRLLSTEKGGMENAGEYLRKLFSSANKSDTTKKAIPTDNSAYSRAHATTHAFMEAFQKEGNYRNVFIIDSKSGEVLYSVNKDEQYMTNLINGSNKESTLARLFKTILYSKKITSESYFFELEPYSSSERKPSGYIGMGIILDGKIEGVLIIQFSLEEINFRLTQSNILNSFENSYLIGPDYYIRAFSDTNFLSVNFRPVVQIDSVTEALRGGTGVMTLNKGVNGKEVLNAFTSIKLGGVFYALIVEMGLEENIEEQAAFRNKIFMIAGIAIFLVLLLSSFYSKSFTKPIQESVGILSSSIKEIGSVVHNHDRTAAMQSASVSETTTTLENISNSSRESAEESELMTRQAGSAQKLAEAGHTSVSEMIQSTEELKTKVSSISEQIMRLSEKNSQISNIISLVSELANETNMLALNAAVEAARAGENGKGFEVVAVEIRKLADESKKSAIKIQEIIGEIKNATDSSVMVTEEGVKQAEESSRLGSKVLNSFEGINTSVNSVFQSIEKISTNLKQQSSSISEIVFAMNSISRGSQETSIGIAETKVGVDQINKATHKLRNLVEGNR